MASCVARGQAPIRCTAPITTRNGACPSTTIRRCSKNSCSTASRRDFSWITILRKRPAFRVAFDGFDPEKIVRWSKAKKDALMQDAGIVRNRAKIEATIALARIYLDLAKKGGFAGHLWNFVDGRPIQNARRSMAEMAAESDVSRAIAKDLRARGGNFVGPTIIYAFMQATGMVNDHLIACHRHEACRALARELGP